MRKIRYVYYLNDIENADSDETDVMIGIESDEHEKVGNEYTMTITTRKYIDEFMKKNSKVYFSNNPILVVEKMEDTIVKEAINRVLPIIEDVGKRTE